MKNKVNQLKIVSLDTMIDKHIGKVGSERRDAFEHELKLYLSKKSVNKK